MATKQATTYDTNHTLQVYKTRQMNTDGPGFDTYKGLIVEVYTGGVFIVSVYCR